MKQNLGALWAVLPLSCAPTNPPTYGKHEKAKTSWEKSNMGKSSMGKSGKIGVTVDSVVCFHVCGELDHTILITNQPMLLLVTDVCLPSRVEKSISPSYSRCHTAPARHICRSGQTSSSTRASSGRRCVRLLGLCEGQRYLPSDAPSRTLPVPQLRGETSGLSQDAEL